VLGTECHTWLQHASQHADECGLAGSILPQHDKDLAISEASRLNLNIKREQQEQRSVRQATGGKQRVEAIHTCMQQQ
jgi:hypothetical protein